MPAYAKFLIGLVAALACGWVAHGPLGRGEAFVDRLQARAEAMIAYAELDAVEVDFPRSPLGRRALLSGPADQFQREGQGSFPGLNERIESISGISGLHWADAPEGGFTLPLLVETWIFVAIAYGLGLLLGWRIFRPRREGYL